MLLLGLGSRGGGGLFGASRGLLGWSLGVWALFTVSVIGGMGLVWVELGGQGESWFKY